MSYVKKQIDRERLVVGAILFDNRNYNVEMKCSDFIGPFHQRVYAAMSRWLAEGRLVDAMDVHIEFEEDPQYGELGGLKWVADLIVNAPYRLIWDGGHVTATHSEAN